MMKDAAKVISGLVVGATISSFNASVDIQKYEEIPRYTESTIGSTYSASFGGKEATSITREEYDNIINGKLPNGERFSASWESPVILKVENTPSKGQYFYVSTATGEKIINLLDVDER